MKVAIDFAGLSDIGKVRRENEDHWFADSEQGLFLVADGMGGALGGGLASRAVAETLPTIIERKLRDLGDCQTTTVSGVIAESLVALSEQLRSESRGQEGLDGMGSTVVLLLVRGGMGLVAQLGDSRAYRLRDGRLEQLTQDHTIVQLLLDSGDLRPEDVADHPARGQLTRFVGMEGAALPEVRAVDLREGDRFLLCSDGLTGMLCDAELAGILQSAVPAAEACRSLIDAANRSGGKDNITALVLDVRGKTNSDQSI